MRLEIDKGVPSSRRTRRRASSPPACWATSTSAWSQAPTRRTSRLATPSPQTQSAVVLESLISQFLFNKAADAGANRGAKVQKRASVALALAGMLLPAARPRSTTCAAGRAKLDPMGELEPQGVLLQRGARREGAQAGRHGLLETSCPSWCGAASTTLRQFRRCRSAINNSCGAGHGGRLRHHARGHRTPCSVWRRARRGHRGGGWRRRAGLLARRWRLGHGHRCHIVWPFFRPSSVRDSIGLPMDIAASPATVINDARSALQPDRAGTPSTRAPTCSVRRVHSTTSRWTSTPSSAMPTCSAAARCSTATTAAGRSPPRPTPAPR